MTATNCQVLKVDLKVMLAVNLKFMCVHLIPPTSFAHCGSSVPDASYTNVCSSFSGTRTESINLTEGSEMERKRKGKREEDDMKRKIANSLQPSSSLWSPQSLSPSHCHWAGMQVHSPNALTAHVK